MSVNQEVKTELNRFSAPSPLSGFTVHLSVVSFIQYSGGLSTVWRGGRQERLPALCLIKVKNAV